MLQVFESREEQNTEQLQFVTAIQVCISVQYAVVIDIFACSGTRQWRVLSFHSGTY